MFLLDDTQLINEAFLEDVNGILNTGEVPSLFNNEEMVAINEALTKPAQVWHYLFSTHARSARPYCNRYPSRRTTDCYSTIEVATSRYTAAMRSTLNVFVFCFSARYLCFPSPATNFRYYICSTIYFRAGSRHQYRVS